MKFHVATAALCLLSQAVFTQAASAQTPGCKAMMDPLDRLTCNARINPHSAAHAIPSARPSHYIPRIRSDEMPASAAMSDGGDDMAVNRKINGICRGC